MSFYTYLYVSFFLVYLVCATFAAMTKQDLRIVFMGTPEFAVASLSALIENNFNVVAVITAPDKAAGRGMQLQQSAVKQFAVSKGIRVLQPEKLKNESFIAELKAINPTLQIVVAFRMLPEMVWNMPPLGTINVHGSLLPNYRGAAPINWAIINGESETGVTTFKLKHEIDTGDILLQDKFAIDSKDNAGIVHDVMKFKGADLLVQTLEKFLDGSLVEQPQMSTELTKHAPKIFTETCQIDWNKPALEIYNLIRGLSPYPAAFTILNGKRLKIYEAEYVVEAHNHALASVHTDNKTFLKFACSDGFLLCKEIQLEGKKRMMVEEFLRGNKLS